MTSTAAVARPYYHTSKERFDLMCRVVLHFLPGVRLDTESLRQAVIQLDNRRTNARSLPYESPSPSALQQPLRTSGPLCLSASEIWDTKIATPLIDVGKILRKNYPTVYMKES